MKEINILGVSIRERSLKESLALTDSYIKNSALNTVMFVSAKMLLAAGKNPEQKEWIESMDLTICSEPDILRAADIASNSRIREVENDVYFREVIKRLSRGKHSVYLLTEKEEDMQKLKERLGKSGLALNIVAQNSLEAVEENMDRLANHMNDVAADVIISMIPFPKQEMVIVQNKSYVNSEVWFALPMPEEAYVLKEHTHFFRRAWNTLYFSMFKKRVVRYNEDSKTE